MSKYVKITRTRADDLIDADDVASKIIGKQGNDVLNGGGADDRFIGGRAPR